MSAKGALKAAKSAIDAKKWDEAKEQAEAALEKDPSNYFAKLFLGRANEGLSRFDDAAKAYRDATKLKPDDAQAWLGLRGLYEGLGPSKVDENNEVGLKLAELYMNLYVPSTLHLRQRLMYTATTPTAPNPPSTSSSTTRANTAPRHNTPLHYPCSYPPRLYIPTLKAGYRLRILHIRASPKFMKSKKPRQ
jgi:tetratricopeptide (TPR) repeat protein